tara:strand:- start:642 stop:938 length:297 start_codon:yes stop_codon:yes gene_type:complete
MKIPHIKQFEDFYHKAWVVQNKVDLAANPRLREFMKKEVKEKRKRLSAAADSVNKLLRNGLSMLEIADALGRDFLEIKKLVIRYDLPTLLEPEDERGH